MNPTRKRSEGGFTLIELMVALVVSTVLVGLVMSIYMRMSLAYRSQQQVSELQQVLQAAESMITQDVRLAGFQTAQGFRWAGSAGTPAAASTIIQPAVQIRNSSTGPDEIRVYYADATAQARVVSKLPAAPALGEVTSVNVDEAGQFQVGDVVVLVYTQRMTPVSGGTQNRNPRRSTIDVAAGVARDSEGAVLADIATYDACVLRISGITPGATATLPDTVAFAVAAPYGSAQNAHCGGNSTKMQTDALYDSSMLYLFTGRAYRIDPTRKALSVLQMSPSGALIANDWQDMGIGFTDLQIASRWFDLPDGPNAATDTADVDTDPRREWYSGAQQQTLSTPYDLLIAAGASDPRWVTLMQVTISLALRTTKPVEGVASNATPSFVDAARINNGQVGDRASSALAGVADASRAEENRGNHIWRFSTDRVEVRNIGVGL